MQTQRCTWMQKGSCSRWRGRRLRLTGALPTNPSQSAAAFRGCQPTFRHVPRLQPLASPISIRIRGPSQSDLPHEAVAGSRLGWNQGRKWYAAPPVTGDYDLTFPFFLYYFLSFFLVPSFNCDL